MWKSLIEEKNIFKRSGDIDLIIGMSVPELNKQLSTTKLLNGLVVMETHFGNCLVGHMRNDEQSNY